MTTLALGLLIVCGSSEVLIVDTANQDQVVWRWRAADRDELPPAMRPLFKYTAECKPVHGGSHILIASSSDGVALVERATRRVEAFASVPNAHSAELLPDGRMVVAASNRGVAGDRLVVFQRGMPMTVIRQIAMPAAHGVVWDGIRQTLWALSGSFVRAYSVDDWKIEGEWRLPDAGGHDMYSIPGSAALSITTSSKCWLFDRDKKRFDAHPALAEVANVKSVAHASDGRVAYVQADAGGGWWSTRIRFLNPARQVDFGDTRLYKARWLTPGEAPLP